MAVALAVWACTLPFVFLVAVPRVGISTAIVVALALLVGVSLVCSALCVSRRPPDSIGGGGE